MQRTSDLMVHSSDASVTQFLHLRSGNPEEWESYMGGGVKGREKMVTIFEFKKRIIWRPLCSFLKHTTPRKCTFSNTN